MKVLEFLLPLFALVSAAFGKVLHHSGCAFDVNKHLASTPPLFVDPHTGQFIRPIGNDGIITFHKGEEVLLACPGNGNKFISPTINGREVVVSCFKGIIFELNGGESYDITKFQCRKWSSTVEQKIGKCHTNNSLVQIGFDVSTGFIPVIELCHDTKIHRTLHSKYLLTKEVADGYQKHVPRPTWLTDDLYGHLKVDSLYKKDSQQAILGKLLGSAHLGKKYVQQNNDYFLARGHMAPKADFFYATEQMATFYYSNAAPQWQTSNGHNWEAIENDVRHFAGRLNEDLDIYTGTHGVDTLPNVNGEMVPLSLDGKGNVPVPRVYWKLLHSPLNGKGIVFVGYNSPYVTLEEIENEMLCTDICHKVNWLSWHQHDIKKGYSYCCEVNEFLSNVEDAPKINVKGLLN